MRLSTGRTSASFGWSNSTNFTLGMRLMLLSFILLKFSNTVNLSFAFESEVKISVEPESQSSECYLSTLVRLLLIDALSHKFLFTISFFEFFLEFELPSTSFASHMLLKHCKKLKAKIPEPCLFGWSLLPFR